VPTQDKEVGMQGHVRKRDKRSFEYIVDTGLSAAQRCRSCGRRFGVERKPRSQCPKCGGALLESEERRRQTRAGFATGKEAGQALNKVLVAVAEQRYVPPSHLTLRQYLHDEWLPAIEATIRPSTYRSYKQHVECHICPHLGSASTASSPQTARRTARQDLRH
jgi:predicted RNA-binding Zn-ribbon protein involved in translation (DUF1610 family)